ncbi:MAG: alpha/beta hydrolase [Chitinophagales bacterium]|jgi:pimeloyl-ACP methyl ester carboxylesterase|nr:alpha/beta hydrolase [Bacteroidota bacterium]MBK9556326.1 alpha/beta hydrolase [Bacteroidota bacterium]MBL0280831.1 alpha/beta hydrolase [Bacteroidota bacterium]MBP8250613.1 alpha/beta hydrolase [Chitinophagales bacterium]MBP9879302.1 alpha/beta hydrolase [Chitinophagales bacterium]
MNHTIIEENGFKYVEVGEGEVLMLLHGLFGALSNFYDIIEGFKKTHKVVIPILPLYDLPIEETTVGGYVNYVERFVAYKGYQKVIVLGNSLGGHIALIYALANPDKIKGVVLTGSSGLFESAMGDSYPKRGDYDYIKKKAELTFYDPKFASKELVDELFDIVNDRAKVIRVLATAKSAIRQNLAEEVAKISAPTLLIWGNNDTITPPFVGEEFHKLIPNSQLFFIDKCGHAPMMEQPEEFNRYLGKFLNEIN